MAHEANIFDITYKIYPDLWPIEQKHKGHLSAELLTSSLHLKQLEWNKLNSVVAIKKKIYCSPFRSIPFTM